MHADWGNGSAKLLGERREISGEFLTQFAGRCSQMMNTLFTAILDGFAPLIVRDGSPWSRRPGGRGRAQGSPWG